MAAVEVEHISKSYVGKIAVNDLSFTVQPHEIIGLIGPNGAGKTTTLRMILDIIKPDSGQIAILGEKLSESTKNRLGYLPEERGMYRTLTAMDSICYFASLKGVDNRSARQKARELLEKTGMASSANKKIEELSKGMGQIIQFISTIIHDPELLVLDEAFSGLDPVNTEMLKNIITGLRDQGKAIILSTHQMNQVEELCDRVLMINNGLAVLYGNLKDIKIQHRSHSVLVDYEGEFAALPGVSEKRVERDRVELILDKDTTPQQVLQHLVSSGITINRFEITIPSLNEIFLEVAGKSHE